MTKEEKILMAIEKGITCNPITGEVFGVRGKVLTRKSNGYIRIAFIDSKRHYQLLGHQFIWYYVHKEVVNIIDHVNGIKDDNRIHNLRSVTKQQNSFNTNAKGYSWCKRDKKWKSQIMVNGKLRNLGYFETKQEASKVYQDEKKILHII